MVFSSVFCPIRYIFSGYGSYGRVRSGMVQYGWDGPGMGYLAGCLLFLLFLFLFGVYSMCSVARVLL